MKANPMVVLGVDSSEESLLLDSLRKEGFKVAPRDSQLRGGLADHYIELLLRNLTPENVMLFYIILKGLLESQRVKKITIKIKDSLVQIEDMRLPAAADFVEKITAHLKAETTPKPPDRTPATPSKKPHRRATKNEK